MNNLAAVLINNNIKQQINIIKKYKNYIYFIELRADTFYPKIKNIEKILIKLNKIFPEKKIILTFRSKSEGGKIKVKEKLRKEIIVYLIKKYNKYIDFVDIEYNSKIKKEIKKTLTKYNKNLIMSLHIFKSKPKFKKIKIILKNIKKFINFGRNQNIVKIVIKTDNFKYYFNILKKLYKTKNLKRITFFTIGKTSLISRIISIILKMPIVYVAIKKPVISTQPDINKIIKYLSKTGFLN